MGSEPPTNVISLGDKAVQNRLSLGQTVTYSVELTHLMIAGEWNMGIRVLGISEMDAENRRRVADDLEHAAAMIRNGGEWKAEE